MAGQRQAVEGYTGLTAFNCWDQQCSAQDLTIGRLKLRSEEQFTEISEVLWIKEGLDLLYSIPEGKSKSTGWGRRRGADCSQHEEMLPKIQAEDSILSLE